MICCSDCGWHESFLYFQHVCNIAMKCNAMHWGHVFLVDNTLEGKNISQEKTRKGVDIRMYHFSFNCLQLECDMLWWWWLTSKSFFHILTFVTLFRSCEFEVYNIVDGKNNKEEENMEVADIRMYHPSAEIVHTSIECSNKWIFRNNFEHVHLWLVLGTNLYN